MAMKHPGRIGQWGYYPEVMSASVIRRELNNLYRQCPLCSMHNRSGPWRVAMPCPFCTSNNQTELPAEVNIHFPGLKNADKPGVFVFPRLLVCLDCGSSSFMTPASELARLADRGDDPATSFCWCTSPYALLTKRSPDRTASIASSRSRFGMCLKDVTPCTQPHSFLNDVSSSFLTRKDDLRFRHKSENSPCSLDAIECWQADVEKDQVRLQFLGPLNRLQSIGHFINDPQFGPLFQF